MAKKKATARKKSFSQPSAKLASGKTLKPAFDTMNISSESAEKVVKFSSDAVKDFIANSADEAQKAQDQVLAIGRESAEKLAKSTDAFTKALYETVSMSRDNIETCIECGNLAASLAKDLSGEVLENANRAFSDNVELSKEFFACRTINDMIELQNRVVRQSMENFFNQSVKLSGMVFEYTNEAMEPINDRISQASHQFNKVLAA